MDLQVGGRTYLVTGGSSGIGLAVVEALLAEGARVATCARGVERLAAATEPLSARHGDRLLTYGCDVVDRDAVDRFVAAAVDRFGGLDGLVNNAGGSLLKPLTETTWDDWRAELELKFAGVLNPTTACVPHLRASGQASVVNVNAVLARQPERRLVATSAARAGVLNLSKSLAAELAPDGIRVNSVNLGLIDTGQWRRRFEAEGANGSYEQWAAELAADRGVPLGRLGTAAEVAFVIVMLLSPLASFVTGTTVDVAGGVGRYV